MENKLSCSFCGKEVTEKTTHTLTLRNNGSYNMCRYCAKNFNDNVGLSKVGAFT